MYEIKRVERSDCMDLILNYHYAKRSPSISYAYGLFKSSNFLGFVSYGSPLSSTLRTGVCGSKFKKNVLELNRLCFYKNAANEASMLIGGSLKSLFNDFGDAVVVSYADTSQGHFGTVYQASNFIYCGLSAKRTDWAIKGKEHLHSQTISDEFRGVKNRSKAIREKYGDDFYLKPRPRKHRYIFFVGSKKFKKEALNCLKYKIEKYPKKCVKNEN